MKIGIGKAPKKGFYFTKGEYGWFYGINLYSFQVFIIPGQVEFKWIGDVLYQFRTFVLGPFRFSTKRKMDF